MTIGRLDGKTALITGASRGIGAAVARAFAREGARVAVNHLCDDHMAELAQRVVDEINDDGGTAIALPVDVTNRRDLEAGLQRVRRALGKVDILVANAAAMHRQPWFEITEEEWEHTLTVNLTGLFHCARAVYDDMRGRGYGKIITVSSVTVELGTGGMLDYVTSKAGIIGFTRALAREVGGDGIRVNCVMPGAIRTEYEVDRGVDETALAKLFAERQALPRRGYANDVVGAFLFFASTESDFVTGQVLAVDGGWIHY